MEPRHLGHPEHRSGGGGGVAALHAGQRGGKSQAPAQAWRDGLVGGGGEQAGMAEVGSRRSTLH